MMTDEDTSKQKETVTVRPVPEGATSLHDRKDEGRRVEEMTKRWNVGVVVA